MEIYVLTQQMIGEISSFGQSPMWFHKYLFIRSDSLLATLLDAVRSSGNMDVHVKSSSSERNKRVVPLNTSVDEETEANLLRFIINFYQYPVKRAEVLDRFNANIPYSGLNYSVSQDVRT